jgi:HIRAN domain
VHIIENGPREFLFDIVGESYHQKELEKICGGRTRDSVELETEAYLVPESDNPYDGNAVAVYIDGDMVGHLDRIDAREWRRELAKQGLGVITVRCQAMIVGGWDRGPDNRGHFGVKLDLPCIKPKDGRWRGEW